MARMVDLSVPVRRLTMSPPSQSQPVQVSHATRQPGHWQASSVDMSVHTGSHVDTPLHVIAGGPCIGELPLEACCGEALLVDLTHRRENEEVTVADLEKTAADLRAGDIAVLWTGWSSRKWGEPDYYLASPTLSLEAAQWLAARQPKAVVFDFFEEANAKRPDFRPEDFVVHLALLGRGILLMEHAVGLEQIRARRFQFFAVPLRLMDTEAGPARFFALVED